MTTEHNSLGRALLWILTLPQHEVSQTQWQQFATTYHQWLTQPVRLSGEQEEMLIHAFLNVLPKAHRLSITFGFSAQALVNILLREFDWHEQHGLVFRKSGLNTESLLLANGQPVYFAIATQRFIDDVATWLADTSRPMFAHNLSNSQRSEWLSELRAQVALYATRWSEPEKIVDFLKGLFASQRAMLLFTNTMTADAMFKADAAKSLLGATASYYHAWMSKKTVRFTLSRWIEKYMNQTQSSKSLTGVLGPVQLAS